MTLPHAKDDAEAFIPQTAEAAAAYDKALTKARAALCRRGTRAIFGLRRRLALADVNCTG
jgi:hypothetical protein